MSFLRALIIVSLPLLFSSCAYLHSFDSNLPEKIDSWVEQEEYGLALDTLQHIKPGNKNYQLLNEKKQQVQRLAQAFEKKTIARANQLISGNEWHEAALLYDDALGKLPNSSELRKSRAEFIERRQNFVNDLETRLLVRKGIWLNDNATLYTQIKSAIPDNYRSVSSIRDYENDRQDALHALVECAQTANAADNLVLARKCLLLADRIDTNLQDDPRLTEIRSRIVQAREARLQQYKRQTTGLLNELKQGNSLDNLQRAHDHLRSSEQFEPLDDEAIALIDTLDKRMQAGIDQRMESARRLYSHGKIEQALQIWESLQSIAPDNQQLEKHIERARRVLEKLHRLQQEGSVINPPKPQN